MIVFLSFIAAIVCIGSRLCGGGGLFLGGLELYERLVDGGDECIQLKLLQCLDDQRRADSLDVLALSEIARPMCPACTCEQRAKPEHRQIGLRSGQVGHKHNRGLVQGQSSVLGQMHGVGQLLSKGLV